MSVIATVGTALVSAIVNPRYKRGIPFWDTKFEKILRADKDGVIILLRRRVSMGKQTEVETAPESKPMEKLANVEGLLLNHSFDK